MQVKPSWMGLSCRPGHRALPRLRVGGSERRVRHSVDDGNGSGVLFVAATGNQELVTSVPFRSGKTNSKLRAYTPRP